MSERAFDRILIVRLSSIGDIVLTTPLVRQLRSRFPAAELHYLTNPAFAPLLIHNPHLNQVLTTDALPDEFYSQQYDTVIDLQNNARSRGWISRLKGAPEIFRYSKENWKKFLLVNFKINLLADETPVPERYRKAVLPLGVRDDGCGCEVFLSESDEAFAEKMLPDAKRRLAICYGARHFTKRFPAEKFARVIGTVLNQTDAEVLLLGGESDKATGDEIFSMLPNARVKNFSGACSILQTAALIARSDMVLTNDTGLLHIASAFQKKTVALFGSSVGEFGFAPFRTPHQVFEVQGLACRPCSHIGKNHCPEGHFKCMRELNDAEIAGATIQYLTM
ncbi:MAG: glycosyltransferase family 9 protein [Rhizobacter sp.]|nr:glycosyltransferase family 9 protein [Chlorobiales bacterium]